MSCVKLIYINALKNLLCSVRTYVYSTAVLVGMAVITAVYNVGKGIPSTEIGLMYLTLPMFCLFPLVTAETLSGDNKNGVVRFYLSAGAGAVEAVIGYQLAVCSFLLLPVLFMLTLTVIMSFFTGTVLLSSLVSVAGFALVSIAAMSALTVISAACERKLTAYVASYVAVVLFTVFGGIHENIQMSKMAGASVCVAVSIIPAIICYVIGRNKWLSVSVFAVLGTVTALVCATSEQNSVILAKALLSFFIPNTAESGFYFGIFDLRSVLSLLLFTVTCTAVGVFVIKSRTEGYGEGD